MLKTKSPQAYALFIKMLVTDHGHEGTDYARSVQYFSVEDARVLCEQEIEDDGDVKTARKILILLK